MKRVMIIGQPGAGKSTFARRVGEITKLPVFHVDQIHWQPGWVERPGPEKDRMCAEVHAREQWIFEGGRSSTWSERLARADTLIWLDEPLGRRVRRVLVRRLRYAGRSRPDLPEDCPERLSPEFLRWIWDTRRTSRAKMQALFEAAADTTRHRLTGGRAVERYLADLRRAATTGNLGIPHR